MCILKTNRSSPVFRGCQGESDVARGANKSCAPLHLSARRLQQLRLKAKAWSTQPEAALAKLAAPGEGRHWQWTPGR